MRGKCGVMWWGCQVWVLLVVIPVAICRHDDDFAFDSNEEFQVELTANHSEITKNGLKRLWGVPDTTAYVGHLFRTEIPKEAFSGPVLAYKVRPANGHHLPSWIAVDTKHGIVTGLPQGGDLGPHTLIVTAHGKTHGLTATDTFTINVKSAEARPFSKYGTCAANVNRLVVMILVEGSYHQIPARQRIRALMELAQFMALDGGEFEMGPYKPDPQQTVLMSGPGTSQRKRDATTAISFNAGCGDKLWPKHRTLVSALRQQSRGGTLSQLLRRHTVGWRLVANVPKRRHKRQPIEEGSGSYDNYDGEDDGDYSGDYDDGDDDDEYTRIDLGAVPDLVNPVHPHRHHHGETMSATHHEPFQTETGPDTTTLNTPTPVQTYPTPVQTHPTTVQTNPTPFQTYPVETSTLVETLTQVEIEEGVEVTSEREDVTETTIALTTENHKVQITPFSESASEPSNNINFSMAPEINSRRLSENHSPIVIVPEDLPSSTEPETQTVIIRASNELPTSSEPPMPLTSPSPPTTTEPPVPPTTEPTTLPTTVPTPPPTLPTTQPTTIPTTVTIPTTPVATTVSTTTPVPETTIQEFTKQDPITSTERPSTIVGRTTETVTFAMPVNQPPTLNHHMKKLAITAGKAFRYIIPADLFTDAEDGGNLTFTMYENDNVLLSKESWIQFLPGKREVYGLPLETHVSRWHFIVQAEDSDGQSARGPLDITVQQHKSQRTINHQFILQFKLNSPYNNTIDWQIRALEGIVNLFRDTDMDHLTVLNATRNGEMCEFVWTNDTLPKEPECPSEDIRRLMKIMESDTESNAPSAGLVRAMSPSLKVSFVSWRGLGPCAVAATKPPDTYPPVTRNQVDHVTATAGRLLKYTVPEDTFFDPEDGGTRNLRLSLRRSDRKEISSDHWLQFDEKNQEFYGLPFAEDEGSAHYQLIAEDSSKKSAYDSLIVEVVKAPTIRPTVEFHMTMEYPFEALASSAVNKRRVVEKLAKLFGQTNTDSIKVRSITDNPTTIIWYNTSLPMDHCPKKEIEELRQMIIIDERGSAGGALKESVDHVFDKDLKVMSIRLVPLGLCAEQNTKTKVSTPVHTGTSLQNSKVNSSDPGYTEYLVTFVIPALVIVCMIIVASVIACVLYRRRRTGKMSVGDEEERQAFRSKGIPVIFQDELEDRTDTEPVHKSPVIMREEKPPLLPPAPDYRSGDDAPYRPPPPFAATRTPPRPKATPTYRKPPPYVPP